MSILPGLVAIFNGRQNEEKCVADKVRTFGSSRANASSAARFESTCSVAPARAPESLLSCDWTCHGEILESRVGSRVFQRPRPHGILTARMSSRRRIAPLGLSRRTPSRASIRRSAPSRNLRRSRRWLLRPRRGAIPRDRHRGSGRQIHATRRVGSAGDTLIPSRQSCRRIRSR